MDDPGRQERALSGLQGVLKRFRLGWRLLCDSRVPVWTKLVPLLSLVYLLWPVDLLPDPFLGLGQLDDLAVVLLLWQLFVRLCPPELVGKHAGVEVERADSGGGPVVEATYRILDDEE